MASLFQVPQPTMGLMGRLPSSRIQGRNGRPQGLMGLNLEDVLAAQNAPPMMADSIDEAMMANAAERERQAAARRAQDEAVLATQPRERVSGWRLLDRVLGGETITEGLDSERTRLTDEANRGAATARQRQILATITDPYERSIFLADPAKWSENAGYRLRPVTTAEGSVTSYGMGPSATRVAPPVIERFDDRFGVIDPLNPGAGATYTAPRGMTAEEQTGRINATNGVNVAPGNVLLNPQTGAQVGQGAPRILSAANGADLVDDQGNPIYQNPLDPTPVSPADQAKIAGARASRLAMADSLEGAIAGATPFLGAAGVWTHLNPFQRQGRANLEGHLDTLKGNLTFEKLMEMKTNSPTGASGLGALSDHEARLLASTVAALNPEMDSAQLQRSFGIINELVAKMREDGTAAPAAGAAGPRLTPEAARALPPGTRFVGMDGVERVRQ